MMRMDISTYGNRDITRCIWSLASLQLPHVDAIEHLVHVAHSRMLDMNEKQIVTLVQSTHQLRYFDEEFIRKIYEIISKNELKFGGEEITTLICGFSEFESCNFDVIQQLIQQFLQYKEKFLPLYSIIVYSLAILNFPVETTQNLVDEFWAIQNNQKNSKINFRQFSQIQRAKLIYQSQNQYIQLKFSEKLNKLCIESQQELVKLTSNKPNLFLEQVFEKISIKFPQAELRKLILQNQLEINIAIQDENNKVAVMIVQSKDLSISKPTKLVGKMRSGFQMLEKQGWKIVGVIQEDWECRGYQQKIINRIDYFLQL